MQRCPSSSSSQPKSSYEQLQPTDPENVQGTLLCYSLYVQPRPWLPVGLIQGRIEREIVRNLEALKRHAERVHHEHRVGVPSPSIS